MDLRLTYQDGATAMVTLKPIWILPKDPRTQSADGATRDTLAVPFRRL